MRVFESAANVDLPDRRVAVSGDWHGNLGWLRAWAPAIRRLAPDVTTIFQVGDWWVDPVATDAIFTATEITRVFVTLGNHEAWGEITPLLAAHPGQAVRVSEVTWLLPRPSRVRVGGRGVLSLGGAASVDRLWRVEGRDWWPDEEITDEQVAAAIAGGPTDVLLTHESPEGTPVPEVGDVLRTNPQGWPDAALEASTRSRQQVTRVWGAVDAALLVHGHMHVAGSGALPDGRRVVALGRDGFPGNLGLLDLETLHMEIPPLFEILTATRPTHD
ncbi:metallophosphoesterase family protein [Microbacterium aurantiacum]|uniref:metallophosphoesterase family protein n=1 Tax=Microbacterium aurantiacum TaxID=162393 RepID=UPI001F2DCC8A|nr:metallophosphoesterase [Microbacterium aurantiacum]